MQSVGKFYDNDANILCHGDKHFSEILRLHLHLVGIQIQFCQLGHAVYKSSYIRIKFLLYLL